MTPSSSLSREEGELDDALRPRRLGRRGDRLAQPDLGERLAFPVDDPVALGVQLLRDLRGNGRGGGLLQLLDLVCILGEDVTGDERQQQGPWTEPSHADLGLGDFGNRGGREPTRPKDRGPCRCRRYLVIIDRATPE